MNRCLNSLASYALTGGFWLLQACSTPANSGNGGETTSTSPGNSSSQSPIDSASTQCDTSGCSAAMATNSGSTWAADSTGAVTDTSAGLTGATSAGATTDEPTSAATSGDASSGGEQGVFTTSDQTSEPGTSGQGTGSTDGEPTAELPPSLLGDVVFSQPSQSFKGSLSVELSSEVAGELRYTLDGSVPTSASPLYESALTLQTSTELRAAVFVNGTAGALSTALYIARDFDATSDLPLLILDGYMGGKPTDKETYRRAAFMWFEPTNGVASLDNSPTVATRSGHRLRGQSSQSYAKTPYRVELWDNDDKDADYQLAGLAAEADWALISLYIDRSLVRNAFVYELGREIGLQAPHVVFAEVYVNQDAGVVSQSHYQGVYNVTETIKNAKGRLNLKQLKEDDTEEAKLSGGYIMSFEYDAVEGVNIPCTGSEPFSRGAPGSFTEIPVNSGFCWEDLELRDPEPANDGQVAWITQYVQSFHDALHSDPVGPYADFIDVASFVDYFLIKELTRDMDAFVRSTYLHKDRDGKLVAGPLWDQDLSLGAGGFFDNLSFSGWQLANRRIVNDWFIALTRDPAFLQLVGTRWAELRQGALSDEGLRSRLAAVSTPLTAAAARDHERWPVSGVRSAASLFQIPAGDTWQAQVDAIGDWVVQRAAWMDGAAGQPFDVPNYPLAP